MAVVLTYLIHEAEVWSQPFDATLHSEEFNCGLPEHITPAQWADRSKWNLQIVRDIPVQTDGHSCGPIACLIADLLCEDLPLFFSNTQMLLFRRLIAHAAYRQKLLY